MNIQNSSTQVDQNLPNRQFSKYYKGRPVTILLDATHAFCRFDRPSQSEIQKYKEFFYSLIDQTTMLEKREISIVLARNHYTPRAIAIHLAMGEVSGSTPMLLFSPVLKEIDLLAIVEKCQISGVRVLARRDGLSPRLMKAIDGREDAMASRILHSETGRVIEVVQNTPQMKLPKKQAATPIQVEKPVIPTQVRTPSTNQQQELLNLASRGGRLGKNKTDISTGTSNAPNSISTILINFARSRNIEAFCAAVNKETSLSTKFVGELIANTNPHALCRLLKALNVPNTGASQILLLLNREIGASIQIFRATMAEFDQLSSQTCQEGFLKNGAKFEAIKGAPANPSIPAQSNAVEQQNITSKLENALRRRQEAFGHRTKRPLFHNTVVRNNTAA